MVKPCLLVADWRASEEHGSRCCGECEAHTWDGQKVKLAGSFMKVLAIPSIQMK